MAGSLFRAAEYTGWPAMPHKLGEKSTEYQKG
jgi:hypothetical protein